MKTVLTLGFFDISILQDVPQIQYVDKIVDVPIKKQRHVPVLQKVPKLVEVPTLEFVDHVVHVPITQHRHVPVVQSVKKHVEVPVVKYEAAQIWSNFTGGYSFPLFFSCVRKLATPK